MPWCCPGTSASGSHTTPLRSDFLAPTRRHRLGFRAAALHPCTPGRLVRAAPSFGSARCTHGGRKFLQPTREPIPFVICVHRAVASYTHKNNTAWNGRGKSMRRLAYGEYVWVYMYIYIYIYMLSLSLPLSLSPALALSPARSFLPSPPHYVPSVLDLSRESSIRIPVLGWIAESRPRLF